MTNNQKDKKRIDVSICLFSGASLISLCLSLYLSLSHTHTFSLSLSISLFLSFFLFLPLSHSHSFSAISLSLSLCLSFSLSHYLSISLSIYLPLSLCPSLFLNPISYRDKRTRSIEGISTAVNVSVSRASLGGSLHLAAIAAYRKSVYCDSPSYRYNIYDSTNKFRVEE